MQKSEIEPLLLSHQSFFQDSSNLVPRVSYSNHGESRITFISGPLHAGKTTFLKQVASNLPGAKIYIDFEDCRLQELGTEIFQVIEDTLADIYKKESESNEAGQINYFFEEIHNIPGWDIWVDRLNKQGAGIFITSSSSLTAQELLSEFGSRSKFLKFFPFSFKEYLLMKYSVIPKPKAITPSLGDELLCALIKYFENGGFPEVIKTGNIKLCKQYFEEILQKGDAERYDNYDMNAVKKLAIFLISNMACEYSFETLKAVSGVKDEETVRCYLDYLEDNFLLYFVPKLNSPLENKEKANISQKVYIADTGYFKAIYPVTRTALG